VILAFIEQRGINSGGRAVLEAFFVKTSQDRFSFCRFEGSGRRRPRGRPGWGSNLTAIPIVRRSGHPQSLASRAGAHVDG